MIKFRCSNCNQKIGVTDDSAGKRCKCTKCEKILKIPTPDPKIEEYKGFDLMPEEEIEPACVHPAPARSYSRHDSEGMSEGKKVALVVSIPCGLFLFVILCIWGNNAYDDWKWERGGHEREAESRAQREQWQAKEQFEKSQEVLAQKKETEARKKEIAKDPQSIINNWERWKDSDICDLMVEYWEVDYAKQIIKREMDAKSKAEQLAIEKSKAESVNSIYRGMVSCLNEFTNALSSMYDDDENIKKHYDKLASKLEMMSNYQKQYYSSDETLKSLVYNGSMATNRYHQCLLNIEMLDTLQVGFTWTKESSDKEFEKYNENQRQARVYAREYFEILKGSSKN